MKVFLSIVFFFVLAAGEIVFERRRLAARVSAGTVTINEARKRIAMLWRMWFLLVVVCALGGVIDLTR